MIRVKIEEIFACRQRCRRSRLPLLLSVGGSGQALAQQVNDLPVVQAVVRTAIAATTAAVIAPYAADPERGCRPWLARPACCSAPAGRSTRWSTVQRRRAADRRSQLHRRRRLSRSARREPRRPDGRRQGHHEPRRLGQISDQLVRRGQAAVAILIRSPRPIPVGRPGARTRGARRSA